MRKILGKLNKILSPAQKKKMALLTVMMIIGAVLQTAGVGMLVTVVNIVIDPVKSSESEIAHIFYDVMGTDEQNGYKLFQYCVMIAMIVVFVVKNLFLYLQQKAMYAFVYKNQFSTSEKMMRNFVRRDYEFYLNADTAVVQRSITSDVNNMYALILSILQLISDGFVSLCVCAFCLAQSGLMTIILAVVLVALLVRSSRRCLSRSCTKPARITRIFTAGFSSGSRRALWGSRKSRSSDARNTLWTATTNAETAT